ncbi:DUF2283 domain-containing protein [Thermus amyloliquefaciens]|uniref:DUF2283 domain-containing protein n=2 Tax=Thermus TaxID=270 RepID=UPI001FE23A50|nr:DUF2283 domain-containing protein [Thermus amyloliquefaciens]
MRITYDPEADALYIAFGEGPATVEEVAPGVALDWDREGRLLGIEILDASRRLSDPRALSRLLLEALPTWEKAGPRPSGRAGWGPPERRPGGAPLPGRGRRPGGLPRLPPLGLRGRRPQWTPRPGQGGHPGLSSGVPRRWGKGGA